MSRSDQYTLLDPDGYTLVELAVTLLITLVLGGVLFSIYLAVVRWVEPWQREVSLENHTHLILQRLAADLAQAEQFVEEEASTWTLTFRDGRSVTYRHADSLLTRQGTPMHPDYLQVLTTRIEPSRSETRFALRPGEVIEEDVSRSLHISVHLVLASRDRQAGVETAVALRQRRPWQPLR